MARPFAEVVPVATVVLAEEVPALLTVLVSPASTSVSLVNTLPEEVNTRPSVKALPVSATASGASLVP